jgi:putative hydrolase of the HAD superfamily
VRPTHVIFDLDNTLYPPQRGVVDHVDVLITRFVRERHGHDADTAGALRRRYYTEYGTTLAGLMRHHDVLPDEYLAAVHAIDVDALLEPDPALRAMLLGIPYTRVVFTNGSALHATRVLGRLGVTDCFAEVFGLERVGYVPKPNAAAFEAVLGALGAAAASCVLVDDRLGNIQVAARLGMTTVLVDHGQARADAAGLRIASVLELPRVLSAVEDGAPSR